MASLADLTTAIAAAATKEVAKALKAILSKVAEDYELDYAELEAKYLSKESLKAKPKGKSTAVKAKVTKKVETSDDDEAPTSCIAVTKKGERCKCKPRSGETTCGRHKDFDPEAAEQPKPAAKPRGRPRKAKAESDSDEEEMPAPKRSKRATGTKPAPTRHEHLLEESQADCEECQSHGGPFHLKEDKEEFEVVDEAAMMARIKDLTEEADEMADLEEGEVEGEEGSDYEPSVKDDGEESGFDEE
jgi:hypothetical protein